MDTDVMAGPDSSSGCGATGYVTQCWQDASSASTAAPVAVLAGQPHIDVSASMGT